jgi:hypothetical protein
VGGKGDSEVLGKDYDKGIQSEYGGMINVKAKRRAIILVASGINTFSQKGLDDVLRAIRQAGIPIYIISTGNMFYKWFEHYLRPEGDIITGLPGRLDFLQAANQLKAFAKESGGAFFEMTFPAEVNGYVNNINALLRNQYSLAYDLNTPHEPGKKYKIQVKVDVNGDGIYDEKQYVIQHRSFYLTPAEPSKKK